jgi:hypothetical protein
MAAILKKKEIIIEKGFYAMVMARSPSLILASGLYHISGNAIHIEVPYLVI